MPRRRNPPPDGYKLNDTEPRFVIVREMSCVQISCEPLPPGTDLRTAITEVHTRMAAQGLQAAAAAGNANARAALQSYAEAGQK